MTTIGLGLGLLSQWRGSRAIGVVVTGSAGEVSEAENEEFWRKIFSEGDAVLDRVHRQEAWWAKTKSRPSPFSPWSSSLSSRPCWSWWYANSGHTNTPGCGGRHANYDGDQCDAPPQTQEQLPHIAGNI